MEISKARWGLSVNNLETHNNIFQRLRSVLQYVEAKGSVLNQVNIGFQFVYIFFFIVIFLSHHGFFIANALQIMDLKLCKDKANFFDSDRNMNWVKFHLIIFYDFGQVLFATSYFIKGISISISTDYNG